MATVRQIRSIAAGALAAVATFATVVAIAAPQAAADGGRLDAALDRIIDDPQGPPGLSVLIQRGKRVEFRRRGVANLETGAKPKRSSGTHTSAPSAVEIHSVVTNRPTAQSIAKIRNASSRPGIPMATKRSRKSCFTSLR